MSEQKLVPLSDEEAVKFAEYCKRIAANGYFIPEPAFGPLHGLVSMWATELVISEHYFWNGFKTKILLAIYDGGMKSFQDKWHIPGGYNRWPEADIQTTCTRIALKEIQQDVIYRGVIGAYKWKEGDEHEYGHPLSLYVRCSPAINEVIRETDKLRYFPVMNLPSNLLQPHHQFLEEKFLQNM